MTQTESKRHLLYHFDLTSLEDSKVKVKLYLLNQKFEVLGWFDEVVMTVDNFESFKNSLKLYLPMHSDSVDEVAGWIESGLQFMKEQD